MGDVFSEEIRNPKSEIRNQEERSFQVRSISWKMNLKERRLLPLDSLENNIQYVGGMANEKSCDRSLYHR